jgi:hypothetical protein
MKDFNLEKEREKLDERINLCNNNLAEQLQILKETCLKYMESYNDVRQINQMIRHETAGVNDLNLIYLDQIKNNPEMLDEILPQIKDNIYNDSRIKMGLYLTGLTYEEINEKKLIKELDLEKMLFENINSHLKKLEERKLKLLFKYNKMDNQSIKVYSNEAVFQMMLGSSITNCMNYSPEQTQIEIGMGIFNKNLEFVLKNKSLLDNKRQANVGGMGLGLGLPFVRKVATELKGKVIQDSKINFEEKYSHLSGYGFNGELNEKNYKDFLVEIKIPLNSISNNK